MELFHSFGKMATDWPLGTITFIVVSLCVLALLSLVLWGVFIALDSWFVPQKVGTGRILQKDFEPEHCVAEYNVALKMPVLRSIDDEWSLLIESGGHKAWVSVEKGYYDRHHVGDRLPLTLVFGRISGGLYIKGVG